MLYMKAAQPVGVGCQSNQITAREIERGRESDTRGKRKICYLEPSEEQM